MGQMKRRRDVIAQVAILGLAGNLQITQGLIVVLRKRSAQGGVKQREKAGGIPVEFLEGVFDEEAGHDWRRIIVGSRPQCPQRNYPLHGVVQHGQITVRGHPASQVAEGTVLLLMPLDELDGIVFMGQLSASWTLATNEFTRTDSACVDSASTPSYLA